MKTRPITNEKQRSEALAAIMEVSFPFEISVSKKLRTDGQNRRYFAGLGELLGQINQQIARIVEYTGYTPIEVRRLIAKDLEPEQIAILYSTNKDAAHIILKTILGIPTSTRLNTKEFSKMEEIMVATLMEIVGEINNVAEKML